MSDCNYLKYDFQLLSIPTKNIFSYHTKWANKIIEIINGECVLSSSVLIFLIDTHILPLKVVIFTA